VILVRSHLLLGLAIAAASSLAAGAGCKSADSNAEDAAASLPTSRPSPFDVENYRMPHHAGGTYEEHQFAIPQSSVAVAQGPTPLLYIFDQPAPIRVVDITSGQTLLSVTVGARTLVRLDDAHGVTVGSENLYPGKLTPGHQFAIYVDPTTPNTMRHQVGPAGR
jgi:hypothetical protein